MALRVVRSAAHPPIEIDLMSIKRRMRRAAEREPGTAPPPKRIGRYEVTVSPMRHPWSGALPDEARRAIARMHGLTDTSPAEAIPELLGWIARCPDVPTFHNYLVAAYAKSGDEERAREVAEEARRRFPNYLFARLNCANFCLRRGDLAGCLDALGHHFDLADMYPDRKRFHISEFVGFTLVVAKYHLASGNREAAEREYERLRAVAPDEPATRELRWRLGASPSFLRPLIGR